MDITWLVCSFTAEMVSPRCWTQQADLACVQSSLIQAIANLTCGNTQGPNLFTHNLQWHNPITQPVIGPSHTVHHSTGSVSHGQTLCLSGEGLAAWFSEVLVSHSLTALASIVLIPAVYLSLSLLTSVSLARLFILSLCCPCPPSLPLPWSQLLSGQHKTLFSSPLSTAIAKLPIHLLRLLYSLPCLQNPPQLQSLHK